MVTGEDIEYLIWTYGLPEVKGKKIRDIVVRQFETIGFTSYEELYERVGNLVEKFTTGFEEKFWLRIDQTGKRDSKNTFHDIIGVKPNLEKEESESNGNDEITIADALHLLSSKLDPAQIAVLEFLSRQNGNGHIIISPDELMENVEGISGRLEELVRVYEKDGRILIPRKPIVEIRWNPRLWVKFGKRDFKGNPLGFMETNRDVYEGMGPFELADFDFGLYKALKRHGQYEIAVEKRLIIYKPQGRKKLDLSPVDLEGLYKSTNGNSYKAAEALSCDPLTVRNRWREMGFPIRRSRVHDDHIEKDKAIRRMIGLDDTKPSDYFFSKP